MNRKKMSIVLIISILIIILSVLSIFRTRQLSDVAGLNSNKITKVIIVNGNNGEITEINDKDKINTILKYVHNYKIRYSINQINSKGFEYNVSFLNDDKTVAQILLADRINVNRKYYNIISGSYNSSQLEQLIK